MKAMKRTLAIVMCICLMACASMMLTTGAAGDGTINISNPTDSAVGVGGKTFEIYKIFDATYDNGNVSYAWVENDPYSAFFKDEMGETTTPSLLEVVEYVNGLSNDELNAFATALYKYIKDNNISATDSKTADTGDTSVSFTGKDYGYYLVYDSSTVTDGSVRSAVMLSNAAPTANITLKVDLPAINKQVMNNEGQWAKGTSTNIGDPIEFKVTCEVPDHENYPSYTYIIQDEQPNSNVLDKSSFKVVSAEKGELTPGTDYTLEFDVDESVDFKITILNLKSFTSGDTITLTYTAELSDEATSTDKNVATLIYSQDPTDPSKTGKVSSEAKIYSYSFIFSKFAQNESNHLLNLSLAGAEFQLYRIGEGDSRTLVKFSTKEISYEADGQTLTYTKYIVDPEGATETILTDNDGPANTANTNTHGGHLGEAVIFGLAEGTYHLVETKAPDGYILAEEPFVITINDTIGAQTGVVTEFSANGSHVGTIGNIFNVRFEGGTTLTVWSDITNMAGDALPETGGMGTTLFTIGGILLMAGALAFFTLRKRNSVA